MFSELKKKVQDNFKTLSALPLFYVTIDRDEIWKVYLDSFSDPVDKQGHNCNCCKSFLRQYAGIVSVVDNKLVSVWDGIAVEGFIPATKALSKYIHSLPITDVFLAEQPKLGTDKNLDKKRNVEWGHFYLAIPNTYVSANLDTVKGEKRDNKAVLKRSLDELTIDATETILELIGQNSLYRGNEFEGLLKEFLKLQKEYKKTPLQLKDNYAWITSVKVGQALTRIRNTAIGTLLIDLSEGVDLDVAVSKFEKVVAPSNYKRPTALVTPKMVEQAKEKLTELGLLESIERRYATPTDLNVENLIFVDKSSSVKDVFQEMSTETVINPKTLSKIEEISIEDFLTNVLPTSKSVDVLLENRHLSNLTSIITAEHKEAPSLFKWNNPFSWSYTGGITDSMKERVKAAGGKVDGVLRFSIQWNEDGKSIIDLDAHAHEPKGAHIYYGSGYRGKGAMTPSTGNLDVDMINPQGIGVENITWSTQSKMAEGDYRMVVHNFSQHTRFDGVRCEIEFDGEIHEFSINKAFTGYKDIAVVNYSKAKGFTIKSLLDGKSSVNTKEQWGIKTNKFTRVKNIMLSPNYWNNNQGNKHYFFILDGCVSDESPKPFFNEFLKEEFNENRKVFEVLASKMRVPDSNKQLSGVGFSETQRNSLIVRVSGKFSRNLKITF